MTPDYDRIPAMLAAGFLGKQIAYELGVDPRTVSLQAKARGVSVRRPLRASILGDLAEGRGSARAIAARTGFKMRCVSSRLNQLAKEGVVERCGRAPSRKGKAYFWRLREGVAP